MYQGVTASVLRKEHDDFVLEQLFIGLASFDASIPHSSEASAQLIDNVCRNYECEFLQFLHFLLYTLRIPWASILLSFNCLHFCSVDNSIYAIIPNPFNDSMIDGANLHVFYAQEETLEEQIQKIQLTQWKS